MRLVIPRSECETRCSNLVEIETKEESDWLAQTFLLKETCPSYIYVCVAWTGGNDRRIEGKYQWKDGNLSMTFTNWAKGEPSIGYPNQAEEKDCIDLLTNGKWNDRPCSYKSQYICEKSSG
ncbi:hepatic lectin-like [Saccostrea echinata]|uniref:hepatic lectin-like n=1 Tax=Saccostrea echinata TaxID=191078 RepID=UPI002A7FD1B5|nr:hepatic lectin-like [Saccostrea echinata]